MSNLVHYIRTSIQGIYPEREAAAIARVVAEEAFGISLTDIYMGKDRQLSEDEQQKLKNIVDRLTKNEPVQYVLGVANFCGMSLEVNPHVLIPRPETEELILQIFSDFKDKTVPKRVLDIGTGSGCIPIALNKRWSKSIVEGWDISSDALTVARRNNNRIGTNVTFKQCDILQPIGEKNEKFDLIVSNPPYIKHCESEAMEPNVLDWEPRLALFVPDNDPLLFYRAIAACAQQLLNPKGMIYLEINREHGEETLALLNSCGFKDAKIIKDIHGNDRIIKAHFISE